MTRQNPMTDETMTPTAAALPNGSRLARSRRWRVIAASAVAVLTVSLVTGIAYASLSNQSSGTGAVPVGSMSLNVDAPISTSCSFNNLSPGDLTGAKTCALALSYTGASPAFVSLTVAIQSLAGVGGSPLYDGSNTLGLTFSISDGAHNFIVPTGAGTTGGSCPAGDTCWTAANELAAWYDGSGAHLTFTSASTPVTWTVTPLFPLSVGNAYEGASATLVLSASAVGAPSSPPPAGCTVATIGQSCPASGSFGWG